jgi:multiple antibiotic resistance protein
MSDTVGFAVLAFTSLLAIVNPLGAVPISMAMTSDYSPLHRSITIRRAALTALVVMLVFALAGTWILRFFGITSEAFRIAGGILFFGIGADMLQAKRSRMKMTDEEEAFGSAKEDVGIIPLGLPTLVGPGAITTVIALNGQAEHVAQKLAVYIAILLVSAISWVLLVAAPAVTRHIGTTGMNVMTRLMGLLVMVVGAQFVIDGLTVVAHSILAGTSGP